MDRSISIRQAVADVEETLLIAITLVILVIFLFLRSASATFIPALAVPISLLGTCAAMYALDYSINNMTLLALTLSVGFVVDDAIVMSGFVSLTLTPMLCARVLKAHDETKKPNAVLRIFERMFDSWLRAYEWTLDWVLARKALMLVVTLATLGGTVYLYMIVPKG